jgi:hypothetical protein
MLDPEVVVNLLPKLGIGADFLRHGHWLGEKGSAVSRGALMGVIFYASVIMGTAPAESGSCTGTV